MAVLVLELLRPGRVPAARERGWDTAHLHEAPCRSAEHVCVGSKNTGQDWQVIVALPQSLNLFSN